MSTVIAHPTSHNAKKDRLNDRENMARALRTSQMMREQAREQINATEIITQLHAIDNELAGNKDPAGNKIPLEPQVISALKAQADIRFKLLGKVLPDLKATEAVTHAVHDHNHNHLHAQISNVELAQRLQLWRRDQAADLQQTADENSAGADWNTRSRTIETTIDAESCVEATYDFI